ncbi:MAG: DUF4192 family protein [Dermatophilaceae bacterium]|nr:DUF4192 domain-containing protein [Intrasporangiaceae bacterium]
MRTSPSPITPVSPATPAIRLRSPGEIVSAVPYLLGFSPVSSLVLLGLSGRQLTLTCRVDLTDAADEQCSRSVSEALIRSGADRVLLVAYGSDRAEAAAGITEMTTGLDRAGIAAGDRVSVVDDRWFDEDCTDERCCPSTGVAVADHDQAPSTMSFHALAGGYRQDRAAVVAECYPDRPLLTAAIRSEMQRLIGDDREIADDDVLTSLLSVLGWGSGETATPARLALSAVTTADPLVRDVCYAVVAPGMMGEHRPDLDDIYHPLRLAGAASGDLDPAGILLDTDARDRVLTRLLAWVRNLPDDVPAATMPALVIAAVAHWCAGDGARARTLVERADALDAQPLPMLETLRACIAHGVRPAELGRLAGDRPGRGRHGRSIA